MSHMPDRLNLAFHHVIFDAATGEVVGTFEHDQELRARSRLHELRNGGGAYRKSFLNRGDSYREVYTPGITLNHGGNDGLSHKPGEK